MLQLDLVLEIFNGWWSEVTSKVDKATVFVDVGAAECLHWNGGIMRLLEAGALAVKEFSAFESAPTDCPKVVFILTKPLWGTSLQVLHEIIASSKIHYCIVISSVHPIVQFQAKYGHIDGNEHVAIEWLNDQIQEWMGKNSRVEQFHVPVFGASLCPEVFVTPPWADLFPLLETDLSTVSVATENKKAQKTERHVLLESLAALEYNLLAPYTKLTIKDVCFSFNSLLDKMNLRDDIFYLGDFSRVIATEMSLLPQAKHRRKTATGKVSILFVDRTLDLATPTSFSSESLLDAVLLTLRHLPGHTNDVSVDISQLCTAKSATNKSQSVVFPGCLAHPQQPACIGVISSMVMKKPKKCVLEINQLLVQTLSKEAIHITGKPGIITADTMELYVTSLKSKPGQLFRYSGLLQQALAATQALQSPRSQKCDELLGLQVMLMQSLGAQGVPPLSQGAQPHKDISPLNQIVQLIRTRKDRSVTVEDVIVLLIHLYSLTCDPFFPEKDDKIQAALGEAIFTDSKVLSDALLRSIQTPINELTIHNTVQQLFLKLRALGKARNYLKRYKHLFAPMSQLIPATRESLLSQVMRDMLDPNSADLGDVEYKSFGIREKLKSGFGGFLGISKPKPSDNSLFIIYVVGGVTPGEVKLIKEATNNFKPNYQVVVGSTRLIQPYDALNLLLHQPHGLASKSS